MLDRLIGFMGALLNGQVSTTCAVFAWGILITLAVGIVLGLAGKLKDRE